VLISRILPPIAWAGVIFVLSSIPGRRLPVPSFIPNFDKIAHLGVYALLGFLIFRAGKEEWVRRPSRFWIAAACLLGILYGATDEWHQFFVPQRSCSFWDWASDIVGIVLGVAFQLSRGRRLRFLSPTHHR